jgi:peptide/nickel transport system substrate-binding protein
VTNWRRKMGLLIAVALVAVGCGDDGSVEEGQPSGASAGGGPATTAGQPVAGGKLTMMLIAETRGMDPIAVTGASGLGGEPPRMHAIYDSLMITDNKTGEVKPALAESLTSSDNVVWTLKLRSNVKFSDGTNYDAEAVKFNIDRHGDPANNSTARTIVAGFKAVEVVDPLTIRFTLAAENGQFPRVIASTFAWNASPTAVRTHGKDYGTAPSRIVGAGPFVMKEWTRDSKMVMTKSPTYWQTGRPFIDELEIRVAADEQQRFNAANTGEVDLVYLNTLPIQKQAKDSGLTVQQVNGIGASGYMLNVTKEPFSDARLRKAVRLAIDPVQLNQVATEGLGEPLTSWFPKTSPFDSTSGAFPAANISEAQRLIDAYVTEKGKNFEFTLTSSDTPINVKIAEFLAATLNKLQKTSVKIATAPQAQTTGLLRNKDYQMINYAYLGADPEPQWYDTWHSKGSRNFAGYSNPAMDEALVKARNAKDTAARKAQYDISQKLLVDDGVPMILTQRSVTAATFKASKVQGIELLEDGGVVAWDKVWIKR